MKYKGTVEEEKIQRELKHFIVLIQEKFQFRGSFEFFHVHRKIPEYTRGHHLRMIREGYIETVRFSGTGHARIWKLTGKALEVFEAGEGR